MQTCFIASLDTGMQRQPEDKTAPIMEVEILLGSGDIEGRLRESRSSDFVPTIVQLAPRDER